MKKIGIFFSVLVMVVGLSVSAQATLQDMHDGTIYDTDTQLSWMKDAKYAGTSGYYAGACLTWEQAVAWAASLNSGSGFAGLTGWRFPNTAQPDTSCSEIIGLGSAFPIYYGYSCINSELGHLYYTELGNSAGGPLGGPVPNTGPFINILPGGYFWAGWFAPEPILSWTFNFEGGGDQSIGQASCNYYWAVRPGARTLGTPTPVPASGTMGLIFLGLTGLGIIFYSRKKEAA